MAGKLTEKELNDVAVQMMDYLSETKINSLEKVLKQYGFPKGMYSYGKAKDGAICLINNGFSWETFFYERREKIDQQSFDNALDACLSVIDGICEDPDERKQMEESFHKEISSTERNEISSSAFGKALKKALSSVAVL